jgi:tetratricopeptide (TPR) repeat protein
MSFTVAVRSARSASSSHAVAVQLQRGGTVADLKRALCGPPCSMFSGPSSVALVMRRSVLQDDADLQLLCAADHVCITALQLFAPFRAYPVSPNCASATISRGARVQIHGLTQKPELNGRFGVVFCPMREGERWLVNIDSETRVAEQAWLRPANLALAPARAAADPSDPDWFDSLGLPLACILEFIERNGGRTAFAGLTTSQVKRRFIMPETLATKQSLCDQLRCSGDARVQEAQWFVSHAWQYKFLDVVASLLLFFASEPDGIAATLWFDAFSTSQHDTHARSPLWWQRTFMNAIGRMGRLVMVLTPWTHPVTLTRAWCILELFACCNSRSRFEVAMPPDQYHSIFDLQSNLISEEYFSMLSKVHCERSECSRAEDRERIFAVVRSSIGFEAMDRLVFDAMGGWLLTQLETKKQSYIRQDNPLLFIAFCRKIATVLNAVGRHLDAEAQLNQAARHLGVLQTITAADLELCVQAASPELRPMLLTVVHDLAVTLSKQHRYDESGQLFQRLLPMMESDGGEFFGEEVRVGTMLNLALSFRGRKQFAEAEQLYVKCVSAFTRLLGAEHHSTIVCMNSLAVTYRELKNFPAADALFLKVIDVGKRTIGENHTDTQAAIVGLANSYRDQFRFVEAEPLYETALECARRTKGFSHPETLDSLANLASMNGDLGALNKDRSRYERAFSMYEEAITTGTETLGAHHPLVLRWKRNVATDKQTQSIHFGQGHSQSHERSLSLQE